MNGTQHYVEAERLCDAYKEAWAEVESIPIDSLQSSERRMHAADAARQLLTKAGIHAQLAGASRCQHGGEMPCAICLHQPAKDRMAPA